jgi:FKBP-type peptidyl-prolyl cis-trans isomerase FklB
MKNFSIVIFTLFMVQGLMAQKTKSPVKPAIKTAPKNALDSFSYALGINIATNMKQQGINGVNFNDMQNGMEAIFKGQPQKMDDQLCNSTIQQKMQELMAKKTEAEKVKGVTFLAANSKRKEVITLPNGLQYEIKKAAPDSNINKPKPEDTVIVNYAGTLLDGREFENSFKSGRPAVLNVMGFIPGWSQILQMMRVGDQWRVYIPTQLAYDMNPPTQAIPLGASLIFDISLEGIKPAQARPLQ